LIIINQLASVSEINMMMNSKSSSLSEEFSRAIYLIREQDMESRRYTEMFDRREISGEENLANALVRDRIRTVIRDDFVSKVLPVMRQFALDDPQMWKDSVRKIDCWMGLRENSENEAAKHVEFWTKHTEPGSAERIEKLAIEERDLVIYQARYSDQCFRKAADFVRNIA
jgi:hypothetical protein